QVAVVAPAALDLRLRTAAGVGDLLGLGQLPERIAGVAARVADRRVVVGARGAEAKSDVAALVLRDAAHPAPERIRRDIVRRVGSLLVDRGRAAARRA